MENEIAVGKMKGEMVKNRTAKIRRMAATCVCWMIF
jgi:hypothetical protein